MSGKSEFGIGLCYCLGLFLCHSEREYGTDRKGRKLDVELWFNGAGDHLFDLEISETIPLKLAKRLRRFQSKVLNWRISMGDDKEPTEDDKKWAINEAKDLLRLIDNHIGVKTKKAGWN